MSDRTAARDRAIEAVAAHRLIGKHAWRRRAEIADVVDTLLAQPEVLHALAPETHGERIEAIAGEELPFLVRLAAKRAVLATVKRWHDGGASQDPFAIRALLGVDADA